MSDAPRGGPLSEDPQFRTVSAPATYPSATDGPVRYTTVYLHEQPVAYLWAAMDESAAGVMAVSAGGWNATVGWNGRLRWAYANHLAPSDVLRHWAGQPVDPNDERCGVIKEGEEHEAASLTELDKLTS